LAGRGASLTDANHPLSILAIIVAGVGFTVSLGNAATPLSVYCDGGRRDGETLKNPSTGYLKDRLVLLSRKPPRPFRDSACPDAIVVW
jgi:hypothetical protein